MIKPDKSATWRNKLFNRFTEAWNRGSLDTLYFEGRNVVVEKWCEIEKAIGYEQADKALLEMFKELL